MKKLIRLMPTILILLFVIINIVRYLTPDMKTEMVQHGEMELSYSFDALVIRGETTISADYKGVLESMVTEGEMVPKGKHVASIYENAVDEGVKKKLISINERIAEVTAARANQASYTDSYRTESDINRKLSDMRTAAEEKDVKKITVAKTELGLLSDRRTATENDGGTGEQLLAALQAEKASYEKNLGKSHQDLYSPASGDYSTKIDGYEKVITPESTKELTPDDFKTLTEMKVTKEDVEKSGIVCKIIDSLNWSVAVTATEKELADIKAGDTVYLRNHSSDTDVPATISYISAPKNGRYVVCATSDVSCDWAETERFLDIDFVKKKYSGLKIPSAALRVVDGETGVYTVSDGIVKFKKVNISYKSGKYAIAEEDNSSSGGLLLYDEVIVSGSKKIKPGMRV